MNIWGAFVVFTIFFSLVAAQGNGIISLETTYTVPPFILSSVFDETTGLVFFGGRDGLNVLNGTTGATVKSFNMPGQNLVNTYINPATRMVYSCSMQSFSIWAANISTIANTVSYTRVYIPAGNEWIVGCVPDFVNGYFYYIRKCGGGDSRVERIGIDLTNNWISGFQSQPACMNGQLRMGDVAFDSVNNQLYAIPLLDKRVWRINVTTGFPNEILTLGVGNYLALDILNSDLYLASDTGLGFHFGIPRLNILGVFYTGRGALSAVSVDRTSLVSFWGTTPTTGNLPYVLRGSPSLVDITESPVVGYANYEIDYISINTRNLKAYFSGVNTLVNVLFGNFLLQIARTIPIVVVA